MSKARRALWVCRGNYLKMLNLAYFAAESELVINRTEGNVVFDEEETAYFDVRLIYDLMGYDEADFEALYKEAKEKADRISITVEGSFRFSMQLS